MTQSSVAVITEPGKVTFKDLELEAPGSGQLLLKALYSSMSPGTESKLIAGKILPLPQKIGYSMAAEVAAIGPDVKDYKIGNKVVVTGEHATYQLVDQRKVTPLPDGADPEQAAFFNLAHTALYGLRQADLRVGEACLVMGQGLVGSLTAHLATAAGAVPVVVTDLSEQRLTLAENMGVNHAINPQANAKAISAILDELGLDGFPVIFEATGRREPLVEALDYVGERGRVVMLSAMGDENLRSEALEALMMKGARLIGAYVNSKPFNLYRTDLEITEQWPPAIKAGQQRYGASNSSNEDIRTFLRLVQYGNLDISPLISHRFSYQDLPAAYELVVNQSPELIGGLIDWTG